MMGFGVGAANKSGSKAMPSGRSSQRSVAKAGNELKEFQKLRILLIIHGYPPLYNAGSEVYTQTLARALVKMGHEVLVFCREEDTIAPYFRIRDDWDGDVPLKIINLPNFRDRYRVEEVDKKLMEVVEDFQPQVVNCGHLNHLSMSLVDGVTKKGIPFLYTLHDFWLNCPRGQFIQFTGENHDDLWPVCDGQKDAKCSKMCYVPRIGSGDNSSEDQKYWTSWIGKRMAFARAMAEQIDLFIAPARHLQKRFIKEGLFGRKEEMPSVLSLPSKIENKERWGENGKDQSMRNDLFVLSPIGEELQMNCGILRSLEKHTVQTCSPIQPIGILFGWSSWLSEFVKDLLFSATNQV